MEIALEAKMSITGSCELLATLGQTLFFILGNISSLAFITPLLNTAHVTLLLTGNQRKS